MKLYTLIIFLTSLFIFPQHDFRFIKNDKEQFLNHQTKSYTLIGFGNIPIDSTREYKDDNPFFIESKCLNFQILHMGCGYSYDLLWDGIYKTDKQGQIIIDLKFILSYTDPCKRGTFTKLKYDLTEILKNQTGKKILINFVGYNKLIEVK